MLSQLLELTASRIDLTSLKLVPTVFQAWHQLSRREHGKDLTKLIRACCLWALQLRPRPSQDRRPGWYPCCWLDPYSLQSSHGWHSWMTALDARRLSWHRRSKEGQADLRANPHSRRRTVACRLGSSNRHRASHHKLPSLTMYRAAMG